VRGGAGETLDDDYADGFLLGEVAVYVYDADREQPCFIAECGPGTLIDVYRSVWSEAVQDPEVAVADGVRYWQETRM
jgi:hypothetical protein